jgi:hypothetical protein
MVAHKKFGVPWELALNTTGKAHVRFRRASAACRWRLALSVECSRSKSPTLLNSCSEKSQAQLVRDHLEISRVAWDEGYTLPVKHFDNFPKFVDG